LPGPGFALTGYAVAIFVQTLFEQKLVGRPELDLGERRRPVVVAEMEGWAVDGLRRPAGSAEMPRAQRARQSADGSDLWPRPRWKGGLWTAIGHSLATVHARARRARATRDHRTKSPL